MKPVMLHIIYIHIVGIGFFARFFNPIYMLAKIPHNNVVFFLIDILLDIILNIKYPNILCL